MISVIIPTWNDFEFLPDCLASLQKQEVEKEIIIVDDGSTDKTEKRLKKSGIVYTYYKIEHSGVCKACNEGFKHSKGNYILFADADMIFGDDCLKVMLEELEQNLDYAFVYCDSVWTNMQGESGYVTTVNDWNPERLKINNYIDKCSLMRREVFIEFGGFDETLERLVDWDMWLTLSEKGLKGKYLQRELYVKFLRPGGISTRSQEDFMKWRNRIREKHNLCPELSFSQ